MHGPPDSDFQGDSLPPDDSVIDVSSPDGEVGQTAADASADERPIPDPLPEYRAAAESEQENSPPYFRTLEPNPRAELEYAVRGPLNPKKKPAPDDFIHILGADSHELNAAAERYPEIGIGDTETGARWLMDVEAAQQYLFRGGAFTDSLTRPESYWKQPIMAGAQLLYPGRPQFGEAGNGGRLTGEAAMMKVQAMAGLGAVVRMPMWHTGIWVSMKAPSEAQLLELDRRISQEKIRLGRQTNGLVYSHTSIYLTSYVVNFALAHIYEATVKYTKIEELKDLIKVPDIPLMVLGLLMTIYPNGYPFSQPCVADPTKCTHAVEELLNISKLLFTDERALTDWQRRLMARKTDKFTPDELKKYEEEHNFNQYATVSLTSNIAMELRVPTIAEYEQLGFAWVDSVVHDVDQSFGGTLKGEERNDFILERGKITAMRQYSHWIERIVLDGKETIVDPNTLGEVVAALNGDDTIRTNFFNGIGKYINATTMSIVAIPKYDCPSCGAPQPEDLVKHPHLIPLDVMQVFFTLIVRRITRVLKLSPL